MGVLEGILIVAILAAGIALVRGRLTAPPPDALEDVLDFAHDRIDEIELARVRSMMQRR
jgi:hypothetical protein